MNFSLFLIKIFEVKDTLIRHKFSLNCNGKLLTLDQPVVMGILNVTPDSFYDGGKYLTEQSIVEKAERFLDDGATVIDIGGASSKPGALETSEEEEINRVIPALNFVLKNFPNAIISVDTFRSSVAMQAVENGASIINDISGGDYDKNMFATIAMLKVPYILMHMQGTPQNMQQNPVYDNVFIDVAKIVSEKLNLLQALGVKDVVVDPGFGFGKTTEQNYSLLNNLAYFTTFNKPVLVGFSRKSMINKVLLTSPKNALNGTTVLNTIALMKGAKILRVHDVKEAVEAVKLFYAVK
jgi:dihydropteroate synthase